MKNWVFILAFAPLIWSAKLQENAKETPFSLGSQLIDVIESLKEQMPCGFPKYGIPPVAPYKTERKEIAIDAKILQAYGEINDFRLDGLNDFDIVELKVNALLRRVNFKFNWNNVHFNTQYNATTARGGKGVRRYGPAKFALKNITVWGVVKYNLGLVSGRLSLKELSVYVALGEVKSEIEGLSKIKIINKKLNRIIEEWLMLAVNDNTYKVSEWTNSIVVPKVNDILSDKTVADLLAMIVGGSNPNEKEPCIPPEDFH